MIYNRILDSGALLYFCRGIINEGFVEMIFLEGDSKNLIRQLLRVYYLTPFIRLLSFILILTEYASFEGRYKRHP
jgi:hypothetical protein